MLAPLGVIGSLAPPCGSYGNGFLNNMFATAPSGLNPGEVLAERSRGHILSRIDGARAMSRAMPHPRPLSKGERSRAGVVGYGLPSQPHLDYAWCPYLDGCIKE